MPFKQIVSYIFRLKNDYTSYFDNVYYDKGRGFRGEYTAVGVKFRTARYKTQLQAALAVRKIKKVANVQYLRSPFDYEN